MNIIKKIKRNRHLRRQKERLIWRYIDDFEPKNYGAVDVIIKVLNTNEKICFSNKGRHVFVKSSKTLMPVVQLNPDSPTLTKDKKRKPINILNVAPYTIKWRTATVIYLK